MVVGAGAWDEIRFRTGRVKGWRAPFAPPRPVALRARARLHALAVGGASLRGEGLQKKKIGEKLSGDEVYYTALSVQ